MIDMTPQFVSPSDFLSYWGIDLNAKLRDNSNVSNKADLFLKRVEDRLMTWVDANTYRTTPWQVLRDDYQPHSEQEKKLLESQRKNWRLAILTQAFYIYRNGDIMTDSGYDPDRGLVTEKNKLQEIEICQAAIDYIKVAGLYNHVITNKFRYTTLT